MIILPGSPLTQYIKGVELNGESINATFIDMENGRVQYWLGGEQVEGIGQVRILIESKTKQLSLDPARAVELDKLLEMAKQDLALMQPDERETIYQELKAFLASKVDQERER
ncbi:MAG: hypothetical protein GOVbin4933_43 [Prokaryotic dsDNA virus sp.]|nr:MAG: hypothetical protein GOVbin4933_43 [Prokaryotic dsDNA virus sp.]|tara:strand:+ start:6210 stop:6545 length:336 start_codon:yes stop_codon:yes gene_type:complete